MATAARDRLARMLRGDAQTASSVELTARMDDLSLEIEGFGRVRFPVTPAKARKLAGLGQPARFGRGEETVAGTDIRDTWEIPKRLVRAGMLPPGTRSCRRCRRSDRGSPERACRAWAA
jgi:hypothetical protein